MQVDLASAGARPIELLGLDRVAGRLGIGPAVTLSVLVLALFHGGYAPTAWGWSALLGLWTCILALTFRSQPEVDRGAAVLVGVLVVVTGWTALSATWTRSVPRTMLEVERDLAYVAVAATVLLLSRSRNRAQLVWGLYAGVVALAGYAVWLYFWTRPAPDPTQGDLLFRPVGYANALGGLVALALPLILASRPHESRSWAKFAAAASVALLSFALYLTHNRAGYLAVFVAVVIWLSRTDWRPGRTRFAHREMLGAILAAASAGLAICVAAFGSGDRAQYWRVAWRVFERHPLLGSGAGTFDEQWLRHRSSGLSVHDAHSLYLQTLSELGVIGLGLLVTLLAFPIVVSRHNRDALTTACLAAYCAFLVHVAFEWDWEMPVVTVSGVVLASALVLSRPHARHAVLGGVARAVGVVAIASVAAFAGVALVGNTAVVTAERQIAHGNLQAAAARAAEATRLLPWASEPWLVTADVRSQTLDQAGARSALRAALARDDADWALWLRLAAVSRGSERAVALRHALALNPRLFSATGSGS